jgi:hypothetical protein
VFALADILCCQNIQTLLFDSVTVKVGVVMCWNLLILEVVLPRRDFCWVSSREDAVRWIENSCVGGSILPRGTTNTAEVLGHATLCIRYSRDDSQNMV